MTVIHKPMDLGFSSRKLTIFKSWVTGENKTILDVGCYDGRDSAHFIKNGNKVYGIEILEDKAEEARNRGISVESFDLDKRTKWPYKDSMFDYVIAGDIIEHVIYLDDFMKNLSKVMKKDGVLVLSTPNLASLGRRILLLLGKNPFIELSENEYINGFPAVGHVRYFTMGSLTRMLEAHGFVVEETTSDLINIGPYASTTIAEIFPSLSWRLIVKARKG